MLQKYRRWMHRAFYVVLFALVACNDTAGREMIVAPVALEQFTENSVQVTVSIGRDAEENMLLLAQFSPMEPSLQLYDKALPTEGIDGIGRPNKVWRCCR